MVLWQQSKQDVNNYPEDERAVLLNKVRANINYIIFQAQYFVKGKLWSVGVKYIDSVDDVEEKNETVACLYQILRIYIEELWYDLDRKRWGNF